MWHLSWALLWIKINKEELFQTVIKSWKRSLVGHLWWVLFFCHLYTMGLSITNTSCWKTAFECAWQEEKDQNKWFLDGISKQTGLWKADLLRAALTERGADSWDSSLRPSSLMAWTRKTYVSPVVSPCTTNLWEPSNEAVKEEVSISLFRE